MTSPLLLTRTRCEILSVLLREPSYGLNICHETGLSSSSVYTSLQALEAAGFIVGRWENPAPADRPRRRVYEVTNAGRVELAAWRATAKPARAAWLNPHRPTATRPSCAVPEQAR